MTLTAGKAHNREETARKDPLVLAFIGDTVFDLYIRTSLSNGDDKINAIHVSVVSYVKASAQARAAELLTPEFNEHEAEIFRRARNAKPGTIPKNADPADYHAATALEAVIGYLFLVGEHDRIAEFMEKIINN